MDILIPTTLEAIFSYTQTVDEQIFNPVFELDKKIQFHPLSC